MQRRQGSPQPSGRERQAKGIPSSSFNDTSSAFCTTLGVGSCRSSVTSTRLGATVRNLPDTDRSTGLIRTANGRIAEIKNGSAREPFFNSHEI